MNWLKKGTKESFYRGSFHILLTSIVRSGFGFLFWIIAAKLYAKDDVGVATTLISTLGLIIVISRIGLDQAILRYAPTGDRSRIIYTSIIVTTLLALAIGISSIVVIDILVPSLSLIKDYWHIFLLFLIVSSMLTIMASAFQAIRRADLSLFQSLIDGSRIGFLSALVFLGAFGIFISGFLSSLVVLIFSLLLFSRLNIRPRMIDGKFLKETFHFYSGSFISNVFLTAPVQILPLIVFGILGAESTASYYVSFMLFNLVLIIPAATSTSLLVEGSHGKDLKRTTHEAILLSFVLLIPIAIALLVFGEALLGIVGSSYSAEGYGLLCVLVISNFFAIFFLNYSSVLKIQDRMKELVICNGILFVLLIGLSVILLPIGIIGVGYSWLISYGICSIMIVLISFRYNRR